jgi:transcription initiation factor TFIIB
MHCPEHPHGELFEDYSRGDIICIECGLVIGDRILEPYQSPIYDEIYDENGPPVITSFVRKMAEKFHIFESIIVKAEEIYNKLKSIPIFKSKSEELCSSVSIFTACRICNSPRSFTDIASISNVERKDICRYYKILTQHCTDYKKAPNTSNISRYCGILGLPYLVEKDAEKKFIELKNLFGNRSPLTTSALSIYLCCQENKITIEIEEIANNVGLHPVTLAQLNRKFKRMCMTSA